MKEVREFPTIPNHVLGVLNISSNKNTHFASKPFPFLKYRNWEILIALTGFFIHIIEVPYQKSPFLKV